MHGEPRRLPTTAPWRASAGPRGTVSCKNLTELKFNKLCTCSESRDPNILTTSNLTTKADVWTVLTIPIRKISNRGSRIPEPWLMFTSTLAHCSCRKGFWGTGCRTPQGVIQSVLIIPIRTILDRGSEIPEPFLLSFFSACPFGISGLPGAGPTFPG